MRRWRGLMALLALVLVVVAIPTWLDRYRGSPTALWPSLDSLIFWQKRTPAPVAGPKEPPEAIVMADEERIPTVRGSYCWSSGDSALCADAIDPASLILGFGTYTPVRPGAKIRVGFPGALLAGSLGVTDFSGAKERTEVTLDADGSFAAPTQVGTYVYLVHGRFPQGDASYAFGIEVYDPKVESPPVLVLIDGKPVTTVRGSACWTSGTERLCEDRISLAEQLAGRPLSPVRKPGAKVEVYFAEVPESMAVFLRTSSGRAPASRASDGSILLPERPATYVYEIDAKWPQGSGTYGFAVQVK